MVACVCLALVACDEKVGYEPLDGMWQMQRIEYSDGTEEIPLDTYFSFQLHIVNLKKLSHSTYWGNYEYVNDSLYFQLSNAPLYALKVYGMNSANQHFGVEKLTGSKLILQSSYARLEFRKY